MRFDALVAISVAALLVTYTLVADYWRFVAPPATATINEGCRYDFVEQCRAGHISDMRHAIAYCHITREDAYEYCALAETVNSKSLIAVMWLVDQFNLTASEVYTVDGCLPIWEAALLGQINMVKWLVTEFGAQWGSQIVKDVSLALEVFCYRDDLDTARWVMDMYPVVTANMDSARCARVSPYEDKIAQWAAAEVRAE